MMKYKSHSTTVLCFMISILGLAILYALPTTPTPSPNTQAAHILGSLLLFVGVFFFILADDINFSFNTEEKIIHYRVRNILGQRSFNLPFSEIEKVLIHRVGKASSYTQFYFLSFQVKHGKIIKTGRFFFDQEDATTEGVKLAQIIGLEKTHESQAAHTTNPEKILSTIVALSLAFVAYIIYYRSILGPWNMSMWTGMLPPVFILMSSLVFFQILRSFFGRR